MVSEVKTLPYDGFYVAQEGNIYKVSMEISNGCNPFLRPIVPAYREKTSISTQEYGHLK